MNPDIGEHERRYTGRGEQRDSSLPPQGYGAATPARIAAARPSATRTSRVDGRSVLARSRGGRRAVADSCGGSERVALFAATGIAALVLAYIGVHFRSRFNHSHANDIHPSLPLVSIAVVPFANPGGDSTNLPFSDGSRRADDGRLAR